MSSNKEEFWSRISPTPVLKYVPECDDYIVYWSGIAMTHKIALCLGMSLLGIFPTPEMREAMHRDYKRLYYANAFGPERKWDNIVESIGVDIYKVFSKWMNDHLKTLSDFTGPEILSWFDYSRVEETKNDI
jgi:hypothetical protein